MCLPTLHLKNHPLGDVELSADDRTFWLNVNERLIARFGPRVWEIYSEAAELLSYGITSNAQEPLGSKEWTLFKNNVRRHLKVEIPENFWAPGRGEPEHICPDPS